MVRKDPIKPHFKDERTLVIIKPDGVQRTLMGEIIKRLERVGLKLIGIKMLVPIEKMVEEHYTLDSSWRQVTGKKSIDAYISKGLTPPSTDPMQVSGIILQKLKKYLTSGPSLFMVWEGAHAADIVRKLVGNTEPLKSDVGSIRGDYVLDSYQMSDDDGRAVRNLVHASGSAIDAEKEISHWFNENELLEYRLVQEQILYDVNLDGILE